MGRVKGKWNMEKGKEYFFSLAASAFSVFLSPFSNYSDFNDFTGFTKAAEMA